MFDWETNEVKQVFYVVSQNRFPKWHIVPLFDWETNEVKPSDTSLSVNTESSLFTEDSVPKKTKTNL